MIFTELGIRDDLNDATCLAAFLSCWLCLFVLPHKGSFLRPRVFKIASSMADGSIYSLVVPVLANIYHRPSLITKASKSSRTYGLSLFHALRPWLINSLVWNSLPTSERSSRSQDG